MSNKYQYAREFLMSLWAIFFMLLFGLQPSIAYAYQLPELGDSSAFVLSKQQEKKLGRRVVGEIRYSDVNDIGDPDLDDYISELGRYLVLAAGGDPDYFEFFIAKDTTLNAAALPGGFIFVNTGLIAASANESELAGVLSHEIAHVMQRHLARLVERQEKMNPLAFAALLLGFLASRSNPNVGIAAMSASVAGVQADQLRYSRDFEREADRVGLSVLEKTRFDPRGMSQFFYRLSNEIHGFSIPAYLSTHPVTAERISDIDARIRSLGSTSKREADSLRFSLVQAKIQVENRLASLSSRQWAKFFEDEKSKSPSPRLYGGALYYFRLDEFSKAWEFILKLDEAHIADPLIDCLAASVLSSLNRSDEGLARLQASLRKFPDSASVKISLITELLNLGRANDALRLIDNIIYLSAKDSRFWILKSRAHGLLGQPMAQHYALAEAYFIRGFLDRAVEQYMLASQSAGQDYYLQSMIDYRLKEAKEELKESKQ